MLAWHQARIHRTLWRYKPFSLTQGFGSFAGGMAQDYTQKQESQRSIWF
jgi:hypothetical protein